MLAQETRQFFHIEYDPRSRPMWFKFALLSFYVKFTCPEKPYMRQYPKNRSTWSRLTSLLMYTYESIFTMKYGKLPKPTMKYCQITSFVQKFNTFSSIGVIWRVVEQLDRSEPFSIGLLFGLKHVSVLNFITISQKLRSAGWTRIQMAKDQTDRQTSG